MPAIEVTLRVEYNLARALAFADDGTTPDELPSEIAGRLADHTLELGADSGRVLRVTNLA